MKGYSVSFVGAGRLAGILCRELFKSGVHVEKVVSRSEKNGKILADSCNAHWSDKFVFTESTNIIFVAVPDRNLRSVLLKINCSPETIIAHTAGSIGLDIFPAKISRKGVFYPLQTFSFDRQISFKDLPVFIEASDDITMSELSGIADILTAKRFISDTESRRMLHLAAVFACNFTNHMLVVGNDLALKSGYSFEQLRPLVTETILKAFETGPGKSQTGPAVRNDKNTLKKHLELLSFDHDLQRMYKEISRSIYKYHKKS